jgi:uncharacterized membrane protein YgdD (TMEM256/DUF423 family)
MPPSDPNRPLFVVSALLMAAGVAAGAFGAHALRDRLTPDLLAVYQTGVSYHLVHGLGALLAALIAPTSGGRRARIAGWLFVAGTVVFSGSLYVLALTGIRWLGAITPIGGVSWIAGWVLLAWAMGRRR